MKSGGALTGEGMPKFLVSWRTTLCGCISGVLLFLNSWINAGHRLDWHDPKLFLGFAFAIWGAVQKDNNVTGGDKPNGTLN